jgi:hypothetical protein
MPGGNYNMDDPGVQEQIRRGSHEYSPAEGKHGMYKPKPYVHQEYPKMLGKWPRPQYQAFRNVNGVEIPGDMALQNYQAALVEWDRAMTASIVNNKAEEHQWLKANS